MEDITISNITMRDIANAPIFSRPGARLRGPDVTKVGTAHRLKIDNLVADNVAGAPRFVLKQGNSFTLVKSPGIADTLRSKPIASGEL